MNDTDFLMQWRESLLQLLDVIERKLGIAPRTSELRKMMKREKALQRAGESDIIAVGH
ncbi:MAG: hypothetical protein H0U60_02515 [Blastocatellia bacterium]|nr:hypothetical protein [Blastocatellia bacterium]